jgi:outer membrane immunogenic protein
MRQLTLDKAKRGMVMLRISSFIGIAGLALTLGQATAADLPRKAPAYMPPPPPAYVWTGCYIGANIGGAWGNVDVTDVNTGATVSPNNSGFAGGGQIGCDYQMSQWVIGIRNIIDGTGISNGATLNGVGTVNSHLHWFDALTARGGYLIQPNVLLYVQGGAAWTSWDIAAFNTAGAQVAEISGGNRTGWTAGGGVEWMFIPHWSVFVEYNYMGFGTRSEAGPVCVAGVGCTANTFSGKANLQNALIGVNYKF